MNARIYVGARLKLAHGDNPRLWWTVMAAGDNGRFAVVTAAAPFHPKGTRMYSILDFDRGWRGPCDLIGNGYGDGSYDTANCQALLSELESGELEISRRNRVPLLITQEGER